MKKKSKQFIEDNSKEAVDGSDDSDGNFFFSSFTQL